MIQLVEQKQLDKKLVLNFGDTVIYTEIDKYYLISYSPLDQNRTFDYCYLRSLYIPKSFRHKNIGTRLINLLKEKCIANGVNRIETEPFKESVHFFTKLGFVDCESVEDGVHRMKLTF